MEADSSWFCRDVSGVEGKQDELCSDCNLSNTVWAAVLLCWASKEAIFKDYHFGHSNRVIYG